MTASRPPRFLTWVLSRAVPRTLREGVMGDLAESYARRAAVEGRAAAGRIYWREGWAVVRSLGVFSDEPTALTPPRAPLDGFAADCRFALRLYARRPAVTALVLVTLGLAIGGSTAIYSVVKPALLEALPYPYGQRLVLIWERDEGGLGSNLGYATMIDLRDRAPSLDRMAAIGFWSPTWLGISDPTRLAGQMVSSTFFGMVGVVPALGRDFLPDDDRPGSAPVAIISSRLWRERFAADPAAVGRPISLGGNPYTIIGVLPDDFESLLNPGTEIWRPLRYDLSLEQACRDCRHLRVLGRLAPGVSAAAASSDVNRVAAQLVAAFPKIYSTRGMLVEPLKTNLTKGSQAALALLFAAVVLVLAIACANVANLLLGQAVQRRHEFAVRMAVGSGRERLVRQVLLESVLLGLGGAVVAVALTGILSGAIRAAAAAGLPRAAAVGLDWNVLAFGALTGLIAGIGFGLLPARSSLESAGEGLRVGARVTSRHRARRTLVVLEVALASVLVIGAVLLTRSMGRLLAVDPGFRAEGILTASLEASGPEFKTDSAVWRYYGRVHEAVRALPGVVGAALVSQLPLAGGFDSWGVRSESRLQRNPDDAVDADRYAVTPGYFETMEIRRLDGRFFTGADRGGSAPVAIVSEAFARSQFPGKSALGERIMIGGGKPLIWRTIVGVVGDVRQHGLDQPVTPQVYLPYDQWIFSDNLAVVVRAGGDPPSLITPLRRAIRAVHPDPTIEGVQPMTAVIGSLVNQRRIVLRLFQAFAVLSLILAAVGIYGVMASGVAERARELGIRAALGASAGALRRAVLQESVTLGATGLVIGLGAAGLLARVLGTGLYGLHAGEPLVYAMAAVALLGTTVAAAWIPAARAARHDPAVTLKAE